MKPIIVDMKDMSDCTEVYEARPNPVLTGFIYLILGMLITAFVWMAFFKMDIVVTATGTVAAADEVATVTNQISGIITGRMIEDGQSVHKGDILYTVSCEEQSLLLESLDKQIADNREKEAMLKLYDAWLREGNEFPVNAGTNLYYSEFATRKMLVELKGESSRQNYNEQMSAYNSKLSANKAMANYYREAITKSKQLIEAIKNRNNPFGEADSYYRNYMDNYLAQYQNIEIQYEGKARAWREESVNADKNIGLLESEKIALQAQIESTKQSLQTATVQEQSIAEDGKVSDDSAIDTAGIELDGLRVTLASLEQQVSKLEQQIAAQKSAKTVVDGNIHDNNIQKSSAWITYEKESIAVVENNILTYQQNLVACESTELEYSNGKNELKKQGVELEIDSVVAQEKFSVAEELGVCRQNREQLTGQRENLLQKIEAATVRATMDGTVNLATDLVEGDYLNSGAQVLSIIPQSDNGTFVVKSYVENTDIAKIHEGMDVTYEIGAYPSREYGTMRGNVTFVSADLKVNDSGSAYYVVETSVTPEELRNKMGEKASLKVGMLCETKVVIESKSVLEILLKKIFQM